ncbi:2-keto-4-pentenoate hydratase [Fructobacillus durionis]|uniref:2-oxo-hept-3-ene-1,7-dioate hydratase n=1 Tax=Fructobacillus durionis TaxID=283737 RepID=A0A1I1FVZ3_9LACO|nr:2-keto-4-pentenoate hydratase [Fructobacillus durionis]SFC01223.1 2-oxo-hept-3-ene-1,7-dioate hydratase [Fructobacillus durionis]
MTKTELTAAEKQLADALYEAFKTGKALDVAKWQDVVKEDDRSYLVQDELLRLKGEDVAGYKVSLTSEETQNMFDSNEPLYGAQTGSHFVKSPATLSLSKDLMDPLAEVELVFKAKEDLSTEDSLEDMAKKTTVAPGVEVPDCRFLDWFPTLPKYLVMADAAVGGYVVYGEEKETASFKLDDLAQVTTTLEHDGEEVATGASSEVLGNPLNSLQWLVKKLASQGKTLKAGQRVSAGTFLLPPKLTEGTWKASFNHGFSDVEVRVTK